MALSESELVRYSRQIMLPEVGRAGQERLAASTVLVVGAGGLGSPAALYLAAAGVGELVLVDGDRVELSNLGRQVLHVESRIGWSKVESARAALGEVNPGVRVTAVDGWLDEESARELIAPASVVVDGSDNFTTRHVINDWCHRLGKPWVFGAVLGMEGQCATFRSGRVAGEPCYRCLFTELPPPGAVPTCAAAGILAPVAGVVGTLQAVEAIKEILGSGASLAGRLLLLNLLDGMIRSIAIPKNPSCPVCSGTE